MLRELTILILLSTPLLDIDTSWNFYEIGLGDIRVGGLEHVERNATFQSQITGRVMLNITLYRKGSLTIKIAINNVSFSIVRTKTVLVVLHHTNMIKINVVNTGLDEGVIYGNSTITIISDQNQVSITQNEFAELARTLFLPSIIIPPILLALYSRKTRVSEEEVDEAIIIEG